MNGLSTEVGRIGRKEGETFDLPVFLKHADDIVLVSMAHGVAHTTQLMGPAWEIGSDDQCHAETELKRSSEDKKEVWSTSGLLFSLSV